MTAFGSLLLTRRARVIVPFLVAYGIALYLVAGAVGDAFSGQSARTDSDLVIEATLAAPGASRASVDAASVSKALVAVEKSDAIRELVRDQSISIVRSGPWTAGEAGSNAPAPEAGVGVALTIELPRAVDVDLSALPGGDNTSVERSLAGSAARVEQDVTSLLVLYDPAANKIVSVHPVPKAPPAAPAELGPAPDVSTRRARQRSKRSRDQAWRAGEVSWLGQRDFSSSPRSWPSSGSRPSRPRTSRLRVPRRVD